MPRHFCDMCKNILLPITTGNVLKFECVTCRSLFDADPRDTLRYEEKKGENAHIYANILRKAKDDPVNPKIYRNCPQCNHNIAKYVIIGKEAQVIHTCVKCGHQWNET